MKIIQIVPGFGGTFYCGNCLRDSVLIKSLRQEGHDALTLPMYLPLTRDGKTRHDGIPVFYGAVNIYLKQRYPWLRTMPRLMERILNSAPLLRIAARKAGSTRAEGLEKMTGSMLLGSGGNQHKELEQLVDFLSRQQPAVVHLSNALLLGMAGRIREKLGIPVVCSLQDEDVWVDAMRPEYREYIWDLMARAGANVNGFIAVSHYYAARMQQRLKIPEDKLHVVHIGIDPESYEYSLPASDPPAVGFLSRMNGENGFGLLVDAFIALKRDPAFTSLRLVATGGMTGDDLPYIRTQMWKIKQENLGDQVEICHGFRQDRLSDFFRKLTLLSVPVLRGEAFGLYQLEALASGVPLVQPALGAFPEIMEITGGGMLYKPNTAPALAGKIAEMISSPRLLETLSRNGREGVSHHFDSRSLTRKLTGIYQQIIELNTSRHAGSA